MGDEAPSGRRGLDLARCAVEQPNAEKILQRPESLADGCLTEMQSFRGATTVPGAVKL